MRKFLIPLVALFVISVTCLNAQVPLNSSLSHWPKTTDLMPPSEGACGNKAGTFKLGPFKGKSNSVKLDTIFLCYGDTIQIDHNSDTVLVDDPVPATRAGIIWPIYRCRPTISGPTLSDIMPRITLGDPCVDTFPTGVLSFPYLPRVVQGGIGGDVAFYNGTNADKFRKEYGTTDSNSVMLCFAPATIDDFANRKWESGQSGVAPGPCVNVNTAASFCIYYLSPIRHSNFVTPHEGNDCIGAFTVKGGYADTDNRATYDISIYLKSNPSVKGILRKPKSQLRHGSQVEFYVPQAGTYVVTIKDGRSCDHQFEVNMGSCTPADNLVIDLPQDTVAVGKPICIPVTVRNFSGLTGVGFSINWDAAILRYTSIQNYNPSIPAGIVAVNEDEKDKGKLGFLMLTNDPNTSFNVMNNDTLFELCFLATGPEKSCSGFTISNDPSQVDASGPAGQRAVSVDTGRVCILNVPLLVKFNLQDSSCAGNAKLKVTASGGVEPYSVTYEPLPVGSGPVTSGTINQSGGSYVSPSGVTGSYRVCLRDNNGIGTQICDTVDVSLSILGAALDLTQQPRCNGAKTGQVTVQVFRGTVPDPSTTNYNFTWSPAVTSQTRTLTNVGAGSYAVTVRDTKTGCTAVASGTLGEPFRVDDDSISVTSASCTGVADGRIFYSIEGGTPLQGQYNYSWTYAAKDGDPKQPVVTNMQGNPVSLTNQKAGFYYLKVTDSNGCMYRDSVELKATRTLALSARVTNARCSYSSDGAAVVRVSATPPFTAPTYTFTWTPTVTATNAADSTRISGLKAGKYALTALESSGCSVSDTVTITAPTRFTIDTASLKDPTCLSPNNGSIQVAGAGGTGFPNYKYLWSNLATSAQVTGLPQGSYSVTATDANGCRDSLVFALKLPNPPVINPPTLKQPRCGDDGCITVTSPANGAKYEWRNLAGTVLGDSSTICNLPGDTFVIVVRDALSCTATDTFSLIPVIPLSIMESVLVDPRCAGTQTGSVRVKVTGGQTPYVYSWNPSGQTRDSLVNAGAGTYIFRVFDGKDCALTDTFELKDPPAITPRYTGLEPATCSDTCNAQATVVVRYNTTPPTTGAFTFKWDDEGTDSVRVNLCPGTRGLTITDSKGCIKVDSVSIQSPAAVDTSSTASVAASCFGRRDGSATVTGAGGNGAPFTYVWSQNAATGATLNNVGAGTYTVTVRDSKGCRNSFTVTVKQPDSLIIRQDGAATKQPSCFGSKDGQLGVTVSGGNTGSAYVYVWSGSPATPVGNTQVVNQLSAGTYSVTVTDIKGCSGSVMGLVLTNPPGVQGRLEKIDSIVCNGGETTIRVDSIFGGRGGPYQFSVNNGVPLSPNTSVDVSAGRQIITYFDGFGCAISDTVNIAEPAPITVIFTPDEFEIELGQDIKLLPIIGGAAVIDSFIWTPANLLDKPNTLTPTTTTFESQEYQLIVFDKKGCSGIGSVVVNIDANRNIYVPNAFFPGNPRGNNHYFNVQTGYGVETINFLRVFDRWGTLLYQAENFPAPGKTASEGWDGTYNGKYVQPGVYIYILEARFLDGRTLLYRGDVTVFR